MLTKSGREYVRWKCFGGDSWAKYAGRRDVSFQWEATERKSPLTICETGFALSADGIPCEITLQ